MGKAFKCHLLLKFTESTVFLCNHSDDCEIACFDITQRGVFKENFPKSPTLERPNHFCAVACEKVCQLKVINSYKLTFAVSVGTSEDGAFLDAAEGLEKAPHIIF